MNEKEYWQECISQSADECGLSLTQEQLDCLADAAQCGHEYHDRSYSPPPSDRLSEIEDEYKGKLALLQADHDRDQREASDRLKDVTTYAKSRMTSLQMELDKCQDQLQGTERLPWQP